MLGWWWSWCENNCMFSFYHDMLQWAEYWWYKYLPLKSTFPKIYKIVVLAFYLHKLCHYKRQENAKWWWLRFDHEKPKQWPCIQVLWCKICKKLGRCWRHMTHTRRRAEYLQFGSAGRGDCKGFTIEIPSESMIGKLVLSQHPLI